MDLEDVLAMLMVFIVVVIPVFGFTARFALSPLLQTMLKLRESSAKQSQLSEAQLAEVTIELQRLSAAVEQLQERSDFERELIHTSLPSGRQHG